MRYGFLNDFLRSALLPSAIRLAPRLFLVAQSLHSQNTKEPLWAHPLPPIVKTPRFLSPSEPPTYASYERWVNEKSPAMIELQLRLHSDSLVDAEIKQLAALSIEKGYADVFNIFAQTYPDSIHLPFLATHLPESFAGENFVQAFADLYTSKKLAPHLRPAFEGPHTIAAVKILQPETGYTQLCDALCKQAAARQQTASILVALRPTHTYDESLHLRTLTATADGKLLSIETACPTRAGALNHRKG